MTGRLRIVLVFAVLTVAPLISESLLRNNSVNGNSPKVSVKMKKNLMAGGGGGEGGVGAATVYQKMLTYLVS